MKRFLSAAGLIATLAQPGVAAACATFTVTAPPLRYDPLSSTPAAPQPVNVIVTRQAQVGPAVVGVRFQFVDPMRGGPIFRLGSQGPVYDIIENGRVVVVGATSATLTAANSVAVQFADAGHGDVVGAPGFRLEMEPAQNVAADFYIANLDIRYECRYADGGVSASMVQPNGLTLTALVPNLISVNLAGGGKAGVIDFGGFQRSTQRAFVSVRSTGPYRVTTQSANGGVMRIAGMTGENASIAYSLTLDGHAIGAASHRLFQPAGAGGADMLLQAALVDDISQKRAGLYRDEVTVTFTPSGI
ncbi:hypothetical protein N0B44_06440 [Roseibacterium beibuensis]|uniref:hypothetical protein n=1 Tax=[Roseibacterium] beibuensis TaxID=1193142 RepID=UPI00217F166C|nr:hypothetical protein [Roseibacterium beibuensis]MCS6622540.1 hypothetical protein [Roseibacterium beibuensis]